MRPLESFEVESRIERGNVQASTAIPHSISLGVGKGD